MLWIAIHLPNLPLQVSNRGLIPNFPLIISEGKDVRSFVLEANENALNSGIKIGMSVAAAQALTIELVVLHRNISKEQEAINSIANWALQFTPFVSLESTGILLEVKASLRLFGGLPSLINSIKRGADNLGFKVSIGWAPTPSGAWLIAKANIHSKVIQGCTEIQDINCFLDSIPLSIIEWENDITTAFDRLGIVSLGQCRRLPREAIIKRFGNKIIDDLDRAYGIKADPRESFKASKHFFSKIELAAEVDNIQWLKSPILKLLTELEGFLRSQLLGTQSLLIIFEHGREHKTEIIISTLIPECFANNFELLINEHLSRLSLPAPVKSVTIKADILERFIHINKSLMPDAKTQSLAWHQLHEKLIARLPNNLLYSISLKDDHRPELAWSRDFSKEPIELPDCPRPTWLLENPIKLGNNLNKLFYRGPLTLLDDIERIETGWWDQNPVSRDYHLAINSNNEIYWLFFDNLKNQWFLHGIFS